MASRIEEVLHQSPRRYGLAQTRWRLQDLQAALACLAELSLVGVHRLLKRLGFSHKRALNFIRSPDPDYQVKRQAILRAFSQAMQQPQHTVLLFMDELTYYRRPSKAVAYARQGKAQPYAYEAARPNTQTRLVAALNALDGQVTYLQRSKIGKQALPLFYAQLRAAYPQADTIYLVQDNWPTHKVPDVIEAWQTYRLTPLFLPTYASWLNPIEKLWRWLKQTVLHLHPWADDLDTLRQHVIAFLDGFKDGSETLLHYVGLLSD